MALSITIRDKAAAYPVEHGYVLRTSATPSSILIHTTNNRNRTSFASEVKYLFESPDVASDYLIGKTKNEGVVQFLDPAKYAAWHAGEVRRGFENEESIGIELHVSLREAPTGYQIDTLTELVRDLMRRFAIPIERIETHRAAALPKGRKSDPEGWSDAAFYAWRATLVPRAPAPVDPYAIWRERWGPIATPTDESWPWDIPRIWQANWQRLGKCISHAQYDNGNHVIVQCFEGGDIRCRAGNCEIVVLVAKQ
jgi:hypothetical protein